MSPQHHPPAADDPLSRHRAVLPSWMALYYDRPVEIFSGLQDKHDTIGDVRGKGLMIGVELVEPGGREPSPRAAAAVLEATRDAGLLVGKGGLYGNVIRLAPPMTLTDDEAVEGLGMLGEAIARTDEELTR